MANRFSKIFPFIISIIIIIIGLTFFIASYLPYESVKTNIDAFLKEGTDFFTLEILLKSRFIGILIIIVGFISVAIVKERQKLVFNIIIYIPKFFKDIYNKCYKIIKKESKIHLCSFITITVIAIIIRLYFLSLPIRYSEAYTFINYVKKPLFTILSNYSYSYNQIFHTFLAHLSYILFGDHLWDIRLPVLILGILIVPLTYVVTRIYYNKHAALLSAGMIASSSILIEYSTNATGFTIIIFIFLVILALSKYLVDTRNLFTWLLFALFSALGFYTAPIMALPFGVVIIWLIAEDIFKDTVLPRKYLTKNLFIFIIVTFILTFILYIPFIAKYAVGVTEISKIAKLSWPDLLKVILQSSYSIWNNWNRDLPIVVIIILSIGFLTSLIFHKKITNYKIPIIAAVFIWLILFILIKRNIPPENAWVTLLPVYIMGASAGMIFLLTQILFRFKKYKSIVFSSISIILSITVSFMVFFSSSIYQSNYKETLKDATEITNVLKDKVKSEDRVLVSPPSDLPLIYYLNKNNISTDFLSTNLYSSTYAYIIVNKSANQTISDVLEYNNLTLAIFSKPEIFKRFECANIYKAKNLIFEGKPIFDYRNFGRGKFENTRLSEDKKEIIIEGSENILKICQIPITIKSNTNYIVGFEIKKNIDLDNLIYFDFFGQGYDNPEQEFTIRPEIIGKDYIYLADILRSNQVPAGNDIYFRIFTSSVGEAVIKGLKIYEIPDDK